MEDASPALAGTTMVLDFFAISWPSAVAGPSPNEIGLTWPDSNSGGLSSLMGFGMFGLPTPDPPITRARTVHITSSDQPRWALLPGGDPLLCHPQLGRVRAARHAHRRADHLNALRGGPRALADGGGVAFGLEEDRADGRQDPKQPAGGRTGWAPSWHVSAWEGDRNGFTQRGGQCPLWFAQASGELGCEINCLN